MLMKLPCHQRLRLHRQRNHHLLSPLLQVFYSFVKLAMFNSKSIYATFAFNYGCCLAFLAHRKFGGFYCVRVEITLAHNTRLNFSAFQDVHLVDSHYRAVRYCWHLENSGMFGVLNVLNVLPYFKASIWHMMANHFVFGITIWNMVSGAMSVISISLEKYCR